MRTSRPLDVVIVDDEYLLLEYLRVTLEDFGHRVVGHYLTVEEAEVGVRSLQPQLVIADIFYGNRPVGIEWVASLRRRNIPYLLISGGDPALILELAEEHDAHGMLHKPLRPRELFIRLESFQFAEQTDSGQPANRTLEIRHGGRNVLLDQRHICYVESDRNNYLIYTPSKKFVGTGSLDGLLEQLHGRCFARVHRSYLVNLSRVRDYTSRDITLDCGSRIPIGRSYRQDLLDRIRQLSERK